MGLEFDGVNGIIKNTTSDGDVTIKGNDDGSEISALVFDMSDAGTATFNHDIKLGNDQIAKFGAAANLQIYANSINSFITESGSSGNLKIQGQTIRLEKTTEEIMLRAVNDAQVELYYDNVIKILTSSTGINLPVDGDSIKFGANSEVVLTHVHNAGLQLSAAGNLDTLKLVSTDDDANVGPVLNYYRNSGNVADNDYIGRNLFTFNNDAPEVETALAQNVVITDASNGSEDVKYIQEQMTAGSIVERFTISASEAVFNEGSVDVDFRVESNGNANMFFVDGGNDRIGINTNSPARSLHLSSADNQLARFESTDAYGGIELCDNSSGTAKPLISALANDFIFYLGGGSHTDAFRISSAFSGPVNGKFSTFGESAPDCGDGGMTLQQGSNDDNIMTFKSTDVAHGMTAIAETDTYVEMLKNSDGGGALQLTTLSETATAFRHIACITGSNTAESTAATSAWGVDARKKNGTSVEGLAADDNLASFRHSDEAQVIFKGDGEIFSNQTATVGTYDAYEDAQLIRAYDLSHMKGVIDSKFDKFVQYNKNDLQKARLIGTDDDGNATPFVNITGMSRLHNGAIWQQYEKHQKLASAFYKLAEKTIGKEEADKLLTEEEIQLLN